MPRKTKLRTEADISNLGINLKDLRALAQASIQVFFADKKYHCGGPIPKAMLICEESIRTVLGTTIEAAMDYEEKFIYPHLRCEKDQLHKSRGWHDPSVPFNVHYTLLLIQELRDKGIPKCFQFGMILLYYKFCKGLEIPEAPTKILL
jgi:hypothetical protein